jgi:hypothetical protein
MKKIRLGLILSVLCCYLGLHNGYLAIFNEHDPTPVQVFPFRVESYPASDQDALRHGIPITSRETLTRLLEDYCS